MIMNQDFAALALQADFGAAAAGACAVAFYGNRQAVGRAADGGYFSIACACIVANIALPALGAVLTREFVGQAVAQSGVFLLADGVVGGIKVVALVGAAPVSGNALVGVRAFSAGKFAGIGQRCGKGQQDKEFFHVDSLVGVGEMVFWRVQTAFEWPESSLHRRVRKRNFDNESGFCRLGVAGGFWCRSDLSMPLKTDAPR